MSIINDFIKKVEDEIANNLRRYGYSRNNVRSENSKPESGTVFGWKWIRTLEGGRGPTRPNAPKGSPTLREQIETWIDKRGVIWDGFTKKQMAYVISRSIHKHGNKLFKEVQAGKEPQNIFSGVITDKRVDDLIKDYSSLQVLYTKSNIIQAFKN